MRRIRQFLVAHPGDSQELHRLPVAQRDGAGFVEQQRVHVARGFHRLAAHREHVVLHHAVHAGDSDGREQSTNGGRDQTHQQGNQHGHARHRSGPCLRHAECRVRLQRNHRQQEDQRQARDQDVQRDLVRSLLALRAFHQRDHAIQKRFAGIGCDSNLDVIRQHAGATRDGATVAPGLANYGRALAGDHRLVNCRDAVDHFAVARDQFTSVAGHHIARAQSRSGYLLDLAGFREPFGQRIGLRFTQTVGLRLAPRFRHRLSEVGEQNGKPKPERDLDFELQPTGAREYVADNKYGGEQCAHFHDKHHRILGQRDRIQLQE